MCTVNIITATLKDNLKKKKRALKDCDFNKGFLVFANLHTSLTRLELTVTDMWMEQYSILV